MAAHCCLKLALIVLVRLTLVFSYHQYHGYDDCHNEEYSPMCSNGRTFPNYCFYEVYKRHYGHDYNAYEGRCYESGHERYHEQYPEDEFSYGYKDSHRDSYDDSYDGYKDYGPAEYAPAPVPYPQPVIIYVPPQPPASTAAPTTTAPPPPGPIVVYPYVYGANYGYNPGPYQAPPPSPHYGGYGGGERGGREEYGSQYGESYEPAPAYPQYQPIYVFEAPVAPPPPGPVTAAPSSTVAPVIMGR